MDNASSEARDGSENDVALHSSALTKRNICHRANSASPFVLVSVAAAALEAHLAHGDSSAELYYRDSDEDGFGDTSAAGVPGCTASNGVVANAGDCDDINASAYPGADERCDATDNDCDSMIDEGCDTGIFTRCDSDAQCTQGPRGWCVALGGPVAACYYQCATASDCPHTGMTCAEGICLLACTDRKDCGGDLCAEDAGEEVAGHPVCLPACRDSSECGDSLSCVEGECRWTCVADADCSPDGQYTCQGGECARAPETCTNDLDDDGDGWIDCSDNDCRGKPACLNEDCDNQVDDNENGLLDCDDPLCYGDGVHCEQCFDLYDNDRNGLTDCKDPRCGPCAENYYDTSNCWDTFDNDRDGVLDCADSDCLGLCTEASLVDGCWDGADNDHDGLLDCADRECDAICNEALPDVRGCFDHVDKDLDGLTDCEDPDCREWCQEPRNNGCEDGVDRDLDGYTDCQDADCTSYWKCQMHVACFDVLLATSPAETFDYDVTPGAVATGIQAHRSDGTCVQSGHQLFDRCFSVEGVGTGVVHVQALAAQDCDGFVSLGVLGASRQSLLPLQDARDRLLAGASEIDLDNDGRVDWTIERDAAGVAIHDELDFDRDGVAEVVRQAVDGGFLWSVDSDGDGAQDERRFYDFTGSGRVKLEYDDNADGYFDNTLEYDGFLDDPESFARRRTYSVPELNHPTWDATDTIDGSWRSAAPNLVFDGVADMCSPAQQAAIIRALDNVASHVPSCLKGGVLTMLQAMLVQGRLEFSCLPASFLADTRVLVERSCFRTGAARDCRVFIRVGWQLFKKTDDQFAATMLHELLHNVTGTDHWYDENHEVIRSNDPVYACEKLCYPSVETVQDAGCTDGYVTSPSTCRCTAREGEGPSFGCPIPLELCGGACVLTRCQGTFDRATCRCNLDCASGGGWENLQTHACECPLGFSWSLACGYCAANIQGQTHALTDCTDDRCLRVGDTMTCDQGTCELIGDHWACDWL